MLHYYKKTITYILSQRALNIKFEYKERNIQYTNKKIFSLSNECDLMSS